MGTQDTIEDSETGISKIAEEVFKAVEETLRSGADWEWVPFKISDKAPKGDVLIGVMPLAGELPCQIRIVCRPSLIQTLAKHFFATEIDNLLDDLFDIIGEFVNVVAGQYTNSETAHRHKLELTLPTTMRARDIVFSTPSNQQEKWAIFRIPDGEFSCGITRTEKKPQENPAEPADTSSHFKWTTLPDFLETVTETVAASVSETLAEACSWKEIAHVRTDMIPTADAIAGILGFGGTASWQLRMVFHEHEAYRMASSFIGFELAPDETDDIRDAIGEIVNVVAGDIAARLQNLDIEAMLSIPTVMSGEELCMAIGKGQIAQHLLMATPAGSFWCEIVSEN